MAMAGGYHRNGMGEGDLTRMQMRDVKVCLLGVSTRRCNGGLKSFVLSSSSCQSWFCVEDLSGTGSRVTQDKGIGASDKRRPLLSTASSIFYPYGIVE